tara:strand:+ start:3087 stop:3953 length:867 start_codon:yes stop_codon:yes gene_type:complete
VPAPRPRPISDLLPRFQNVAQSSHYIVKFALPHSFERNSLRSHLRRKGVNDRFILEDAGLLCSNAVLPGSALASVDTRGNFQGVIERFAHTRNFTQINLEFYVDNEYKSMKFLEHWIEYITGAVSDPTSDAYHFELNYPEEYKSNETKIVKFERDYNRFLEYRFIGLFPLALNSTRVSYQGSQVLKASASFSFDRYICGESSSLARDLGIAFNEIFGLRGNPIKDGGSVANSRNILNQNAYGIIRDGVSNSNLPYSGAGSNNSSNPNGAVSTLGGTNLGSGTSNTFNV